MHNFLSKYTIRRRILTDHEKENLFEKRERLIKLFVNGLAYLPRIGFYTGQEFVHEVVGIGLPAKNNKTQHLSEFVVYSGCVTNTFLLYKSGILNHWLKGGDCKSPPATANFGAYPKKRGAELIKHFKQLDQLPEEEKKSILKVVAALIRDYNAKQAYLL